MGAEKEFHHTTTSTLENGVVVEAADAEYTTSGLQRKLKARHVQMIAIGSSIGTGLFIGSGKSLHIGGPLALVMGFVLIAVALSSMVYCLGEMSVVIPVSGAFTRYATRFLDPSLGFAVGWQYWLAWVSVFGAEASAFRILIQFWNDDDRYTPLWISIFILINLCIHFSPVRVFGEVEFFVSALKVVAVVGFIIVTWAIMAGAGPTGRTHGGEYWTAPGLNNGLYNGFFGLASVFANAAFASGGVEMVGVVAGEAQQPRWNLPRGIRTLMWRIIIFYVFSMLFLSFVVRYDNDNLLGSSNAGSSPFVVAIQEAGIRVLPDILNAVLLVCVCSVGSSSVYIASRTLQAMGEDGFAARIFIKTDKQGRPWTALVFTGAICIILAYLNCSASGRTVFSWFSAISGLAFLVAWLVIIVCNWRFRAALKAQSDDTLDRPFAFKSPLWPWFSILGFVLIVFMIVCQFVISVKPIGAPPSAANFFQNFLSIPVFLVSWAGYKVLFWRTSKFQSLKDMDLQTGRREEDPAETEKIAHYHSLPWAQRALSYVRF